MDARGFFHHGGGFGKREPSTTVGAIATSCNGSTAVAIGGDLEDAPAVGLAAA
jgi:hypothetical protein